MVSNALRLLVADLRKSRERFIATRASTIHRLRECATRLERAGKLCKAGEIAGKATVVGGGVMTVSATVVCVTLGAAAPCAVPLLVAGSATAAVGSAVKTGCRFTLRIKSKRRSQEIEDVLRIDEQVTGGIIDNLIRALTYTKKAALTDELKIASDVVEAAQLLSSCAPEQMIEISDLVADISGVNGLDISPFYTNESMILSSIPGLNQALGGLGVLDVGASDVIEFIGEMIIGDVLPLRSILLPVYIVSLLRGIHKFSKKTYLTTAKCVRRVAEKLENEGELATKLFDTIITKLLEM